MNTITFKDWLLPKLQEKNLSIAKLAYEMGVSRTIIYHYTKDINRPTPANIEKICSVLGADVNELNSIIVQRTNGRPVGSTKKYGAETPKETILENLQPVSTSDLTSYDASKF